MKSIVICCLVLALGLCSNGDGDCMKEWKEFNAELKPKLCDPDKTDDNILTAIVACQTTLGMKNGNGEGKKNKFYELCGTPNEDDIKAYTKVTNDLNKKVLMGFCSDKMKECVHKKFEEMKASGELKKPDPKDRPKLSDQQKDDFKTCMKKAVGL